MLCPAPSCLNTQFCNPMSFDFVGRCSCLKWTSEDKILIRLNTPVHRKISVTHCNRVLSSFKSNHKYSLGGCHFTVFWNTALVKCHFVLSSTVAFAMYILPCFCTETARHTGASALEIDFSSCLVLAYIARARVGCERGGQEWYLFTEPWGRTLANGWAALSCWNDCSFGTFLGFAMIRADL